MRFDLTFYPVVCVFLILLVLLTQRIGSGGKSAPAVPKPPKPKREPKPFTGFTRKPQCELCKQQARSQPQPPSVPPPPMMVTRGCPRQVDTTGHFCPHATCSYHGRVDFGNLRANGHPNGRRWRQLYCLSCRGYFLETRGTPFHGKQVDPDKLV